MVILHRTGGPTQFVPSMQKQVFWSGALISSFFVFFYQQLALDTLLSAKTHGMPQRLYK